MRGGFFHARSESTRETMCASRRARHSLVVDLIRGKRVGEAIAILRHTPKAASPIVEKAAELGDREC